MHDAYDIAVIGGGPAGSAAAITAARAGMRVLQLERGSFPRQRVCGEFVSPESLTTLEKLLGNSEILREAPRVSRTRIFVDAEIISAPLSPPAASIPRFELDAALWQAAQSAGADCRQNVAVENIEPAGTFKVKTPRATFFARAVINATGRWSNLNKELAPNGEKQLGMKAHFREPNTPASVDLYFFAGGYCGVQPVAKDAVNVCAMARPNVARSLPEIFEKHPELWRRSRAWKQMFPPLSTSPLVFRKPQPTRDGMLQAGDAAGFIDPFAGDGISLALRSGVMAAESLLNSADPLTALEAYEERYSAELLSPFRAASRIRKLFGMPKPLRKITAKAIQWTGAAQLFVGATR